VVVLILFFLSGFASLLLETVYRRQLALVLGSAVTATSATLAVFLAGLAIGAVVFGAAADRARRPLRLYGALELSVAVTGSIAMIVLARAQDAAGAAWTSIALLLLPTACMGGTLPALIRHRVRAGAPLLRPLATLYGINTLGAAAGAAASGFVLFERVGVLRTGWIAITLAALSGAAALALDPGPAPSTPPAKLESEATRGEPVAVACAALGGAAALGYEVLWTRLLALPLRSYSYSFSLMLALFLVGLVGGTLLVAGLAPRIERPLRALAVTQLAAGAYVAASVIWLPSILSPASEGGGFGAFAWNGLLRAGPVVLPPTFLSGMALPLAVRAFAPGAARAARGVGRVYAANTLGSIAGALAAGLAVLPALGASRALALFGALGAAAGAAAAVRTSRAWGAWAVVALCALAVARPPGAFVAAYAKTGRAPRSTSAPLFFREGATDTVAVVRREYGFRDPDAKSVVVNGIAMTATVKPVWRYMAAEGHLPALLAPPRSRAMLICVGTGITLRALASHEGIVAVDAVDLSESMLAALPVFSTENREVFRDPKVRMIHADGRRALARASERYGVITLEPPPPIVAGSVHLYTLDFYRLCRSRLAAGGVVAQWLPLHAQSLDSARATARTFLEAFPHVQLWLPSIRDAVLVGSDAPLALDPARLRAAYASPATRASLEAAYFETPEALVATFLLDREGVAQWSRGADLVTDDRPAIEFFRRYGLTMSDREIATLLAVAPAPLPALFDPPDPATLAAAEVERRAHVLYLRSEIEGDVRLAREAALASRGTRFGLYRLGCDGPQLDALRRETEGGAAWARQVEACRPLALGM